MLFFNKMQSIAFLSIDCIYELCELNELCWATGIVLMDFKGDRDAFIA